ncbi:MAG: CopD family protein [Candidatus Dormibacteria bacterium]
MTWAAAAHLVFYAGFITLLGGWLVLGVVGAAPTATLMRLLTGGWMLAAAGALVLAMQAHDALGLSYGAFLGTHLGLTSLVRGLPLLVAHEGLSLVRSAGRRRRQIGIHVVGAATALSLWGHILATHADVGPAAPLRIGIGLIHVAAVGAWIGGLGVLLVAVWGAPGEDKARLIRRFSSAAGVCVGLLALSGLGAALFEIQAPEQLLTTDYGRLLVAKTALLMVLALLGAINRYRFVPAAISSLTGLRRTAVTELGFAAMVLTLSGILSGTEPPLTPVRAAAVPRASAAVWADRAGIKVELTRPATIMAAAPATIVYRFTDAALKPVTDIVLSHGRPVHLTVVAADLSTFQYLDPVPTAQRGEYRAVVTFPTPGTYLLFAEFTRSSGEDVVERETVQVPGAAPRTSPLGVTTPVQVARGVRVKLTSVGTLRAGTPAHLVLHVEDARTGAPIGNLLPYRGDAAQAIAIGPAGDTYLSFTGSAGGSSMPDMPSMTGMSMPSSTDGPDIDFSPVFATTGPVKIWFQFEDASGALVTIPYVLAIA